MFLGHRKLNTISPKCFKLSLYMTNINFIVVKQNLLNDNKTLRKNKTNKLALNFYIG